METVKIGDRIFKECDDVPLAVKEKRKLFWINNNAVFEMRCVSESIGPTKNLLFLYDAGGSMGEGTFTHYRGSSSFNWKLYFDVTPEKRYAIWWKQNHEETGSGKFVGTYFSDRDSAERALEKRAAGVNRSRNEYAIVEFDNPDAE